VEAGSSVERLVFTATTSLEVGACVVVPIPAGEDLLFQLYNAEVLEAHVRGGAHLTVRATANQVGVFRPESMRLEQFRWVPPPGAPVLAHTPSVTVADPPAGKFLVGSVLGAEIPVYLDLDDISEGHLAVLGMTKMGKTTFCLRLANAIAQTRRVIFLDQTGEYSTKRGIAEYDSADPWCAGIRVHGPSGTQIGPDFAYGFLDQTMDSAAAEYGAGDPMPRTLLLDEAHQFVPEPAGMGFNAPGRESAINFGLAVLRVRKYGISIVLISQRTAVVAKSALSQCENLVAFRSVDQTGLDYLEAIGGTGMRAILPRLKQGEAVVTGPAFSSESPVVVAVRQA
jgi:DNA helicase HerA-like ATPase